MRGVKPVRFLNHDVTSIAGRNSKLNMTRTETGILLSSLQHYEVEKNHSKALRLRTTGRSRGPEFAPFTAAAVMKAMLHTLSCKVYKYAYSPSGL